MADNRTWIMLQKWGANADTYESWEVAQSGLGDVPGVVVLGPVKITPTDDPTKPRIDQQMVNVTAKDALKLADALTKVAHRALGVKPKPRKRAAPRKPAKKAAPRKQPAKKASKR